MSDWQKGDLALCVRKPNAHYGLIFAGGVYTVSHVSTTRDWKGETGLAFEGVEPPSDERFYPYWAASRFRKIEPHTPDEEDRTAIELLNRVKERV